MANQKLAIIIDVDPRSGKAGIRAVRGELKDLGKATRTTEQAVGSLFDRFGQAPLMAFGFNEIVEAMQRILSVAGDLVRVSDQWTDIEARIRVATGSQEAAAQSMERLTQIALDAHAPFQGVAELFARLALNVKRPREELLDFTQAITDSMRVAGTNAAEASGAMIQLTQALASGVLRGEEFNSVSEQMPLVLQAIERQTGKSRAELRKMAEQGKLTADVVIAAVLAMKDEWREDASKMPITFGRALEDWKTRFGAYQRESKKMQELIRALDEAVTVLGENLDEVLDVLGDVARVAGDFLLVLVGAKMAAAIRNIGGLTKAMRALGRAIPFAVIADQVGTLIAEMAKAEAIVARLERERVKAVENAEKAILEHSPYAEMRRLSEDELAALGSAEQKRYLESLQRAERYYAALVTKANLERDTLRALNPIAALFDDDGFAGDVTKPVSRQTIAYQRSLREIRAAIRSAQAVSKERAEAERRFSDRVQTAMEQQKRAIKDAMKEAKKAYRDAERAAEKAARQHEDLVREYQRFADNLKRPAAEDQDFGFLEASQALLTLKNQVRDGLFDEAIEGAEELKARLEEMARDASGTDRQALAGLAQELVRVVDEAGKGKEILAQQEVENARKRIQQLKNEAEALKHIQVEFDADASADELQRRIQAMARELADALVIPVTFRKEGGPIGVPGFSNGGPLPGYGGGDRILALLEGGEFVLRKEAVAAYGRGFVSAINNLSLPQLPRFASGGAVGNAAAPAGEVVTLNLNLGGRTHTLFGARDQVNGLVDAMRRLERAV